MAPTVLLYARPDCHLCAQAREGLARMQAEGAVFELREIDIESDDELFKRYLERIPVVLVEGEEACDLWLDPRAVTARLATLST